MGSISSPIQPNQSGMITAHILAATRSKFIGLSYIPSYGKWLGKPILAQPKDYEIKVWTAYMFPTKYSSSQKVEKFSHWPSKYNPGPMCS